MNIIKLNERKTLRDFIHKHTLNGGRFFLSVTMRYWNSKIESELIEGEFFVTSEADMMDRTRRYSIRLVSWDRLDITTLGELGMFKDLKSAQDWLTLFLKEQKNERR